MVHVGTLLKQHRCNVCFPVTTGHYQRRAPIDLIYLVHLRRFVAQQHFDNGLVAFLAGEHERSPAIIFSMVHVSTLLKQHRRHLCMAIKTGHYQRRLATWYVHKGCVVHGA